LKYVLEAGNYECYGFIIVIIFVIIFNLKHISMRHIFGALTMSQASFENYRYATPLGNNGLMNKDFIRLRRCTWWSVWNVKTLWHIRKIT